MSGSMRQPAWNFEPEPWPEPPDETAINLRAYFDRMPDGKMRQYSPNWPDERVTERDVEAAEYRRVLEERMRYRDRVRNQNL
jgi:hypothetical protein